MLTLHTFGPNFGLPDPSPFVVKSLVHLKMSGLPFRTALGDLAKAPKRKLPILDDDGAVVADSTFILRHLETKYGFDLDKGLSASERAMGWALEKMCEEHLHWAVVDARWMVDANFNKGPRHFFDAVPALIRPIVISAIRRGFKRTLHGQGFGRHTRTEIEDLASRDLGAIADILGDKPFLFGPEPHAADATVYAFLASVRCPLFETGLRDHLEKHLNLLAYVERGTERWFSAAGAS